jgi:magnesium transporter
LLESLARKENLVRIGQLLNQIQAKDILKIIAALSLEDQYFVWDHLNDARKESVLQAAPDAVLKLLQFRGYQAEKNHVKAFYLDEGRLKETPLHEPQALRAKNPIWIDLVDPSFEDRLWVGEIFGIKIPDPEKLSDLEASAKFYLEEQGEIHLHSDFLLDKDDVSKCILGIVGDAYSDRITINKDPFVIFCVPEIRGNIHSPNGTR